MATTGPIIMIDDDLDDLALYKKAFMSLNRKRIPRKWLYDKLQLQGFNSSPLSPSGGGRTKDKT